MLFWLVCQNARQLNSQTNSDIVVKLKRNVEVKLMNQGKEFKVLVDIKMNISVEKVKAAFIHSNHERSI